MEISDIQEWLKAPNDYNAGVNLYLKHGKNETLVSLFKSGNTFYTRKKLHSELTDIVKSNPVKLTKVRTKIIPELLPEDLKPEYNKLGDLIRQISHLQGKLCIAQTKEQRYELAAEIVALGEQRRSIYARLDKWVATGNDSLKPKVNEVADESKELMLFRLKKELQLLRSQRSKLKNKPHRIADYNSVCEKIKSLESKIADAG